MDLHTITAVKRPASPDELVGWPQGHAWLGGGTWLFSQPQPTLNTLVDLAGFDWPALTVTEAGLEIAATCRIIELDQFSPPASWLARPLLRECCRSLLASFKVMNTATIGGNICMSLPAGALIALTVALEAHYTLWPRGGTPRVVDAAEFVTGDHRNILAPGELLRSIAIPATALAKRYAFRRMTLTHLGRSAALLIGTQSPGADDLTLTITAATPRPVRLYFPAMPDAEGLRATIRSSVSDDGFFDDVNGTPAYKRHLTYHFAEQIRQELGAGA
ncbi:FAD-binding molybdopterin dehydrogenase [Dankookia rubra]|uniref:FAD-binding molybdopterin dehydrogenase n=1 Tax=Dankookia rubra TaxID=1442381 RepID=A0A4R5Q768_9PROT|nr:FAD binding domain-containing protein [Dankookia rubra]TDH58403.1 FAD-binding molybdopterin dehydrogenase [Dankookia rubra]